VIGGFLIDPLDFCGNLEIAPLGIAMSKEALTAMFTSIRSSCTAVAIALAMLIATKFIGTRFELLHPQYLRYAAWLGLLASFGFCFTFARTTPYRIIDHLNAGIIVALLTPAILFLEGGVLGWISFNGLWRALFFSFAVIGALFISHTAFILVRASWRVSQ
jgi:hypothetical protein